MQLQAGDEIIYDTGITPVIAAHINEDGSQTINLKMATIRLPKGTKMDNWRIKRGDDIWEFNGV